ncbi:MAG: response regulator [Micavibrio sp.]
MANILLTEDDASMRGFVAGALERAGHRVTCCADGNEALARLEAENADFQLLLTDIVMPVMDGIELSTRASILHPDLKIMFLTGFAAMAAGKTDIRNPAMRVISKPFHLGSLIDEVNKLLDA